MSLNKLLSLVRPCEMPYLLDGKSFLLSVLGQAGVAAPYGW